jgi:hypothetical protein
VGFYTLLMRVQMDETIEVELAYIMLIEMKMENN